ncbi:actin cytoskeleton-regulatory complex protein pan1-like isoform X9 [Lates japonicus]|uniref:Actin cytoskeleton-regulatory complex protein pan1-like isoform X9 n=1 Tax=Lates japonicus TaxID=270547 RepID=A0AAD3NIJ1_LATJO|nr:actin cytoskeleton-regulatory complex protein pan1-like isoform X9 [Lates japonicus]
MGDILMQQQLLSPGRVPVQNNAGLRAADSETQRSSQGDSQDSGQKSSQLSNSDEEKPSQEDLKVSQQSPSPSQSDTTEVKIPANMKPEELTVRLQELQGLIPEDCMKVKNRALWYPVTVKVFCEVTGETFGAHETILEQVKKKGLTSTPVKIIRDPKKCDFIIVFCPIVSRAGSDVEAAMRKISGSKPVILVLMHHTRKPDHSTREMMWSETFPGIVLKVNILYHETEGGLLTCSENDKAIKQIRKELKKHQGPRAVAPWLAMFWVEQVQIRV